MGFQQFTVANNLQLYFMDIFEISLQAIALLQMLKEL